jgi:DNA polymerase III epsilon subunit-like protein
MRAIIFDTETNGFKRSYAKGPKLTDKQGRVIQLAWEVFNLDTMELEKEVVHLIKPDGWLITNVRYFMNQGQTEERALLSAGFWIKNGFDTYKSKREGLDMPDVLREFVADINAGDLLVAHNLQFDKDVLSNEMIRYGIRADKKLPTFCTCNDVKQIGKMKLSALYQYLFNKDLTGAHDAAIDRTACRLCFVELIKRGLIELKAIPL